MSDFIIGVAGNPNCGKTTMFNALTGAKQRVGNWPGVTVDKKIGYYRHGGKEIELIDLPGIYSLSASSLDEQVARDYILSGEPDLIIDIVDASNLERNLYLTSQVLEMKVPVIVALNMMDIARDRNIEIDVDGLSRELDCPVVPIVASRGEGIERLKDAINRAAQEKHVSSAGVTYPDEIEDAIEQLMPQVARALPGNTNPQWMAMKLLEGDQLVSERVGTFVESVAKNYIKAIESKLDEETDILIANSRYTFISGITKKILKKTEKSGETLSDRIDHIVLNRVIGIPIFLIAMYLMFLFTIDVGGAFIDFFDILGGTIFVDGFGKLLGAIGSPAWLITILAEGFGGAIQTVGTFIPPIGFMFLALSFLEDSGYMARAAFVMDRFMKHVGLPGKSFIPMLVGFGCNVPAIMATRTLENEKDRIMTIMMNPFMSCGARLPVYALFAAAFFSTGGQTMVFSLYLIGIAFAILTGLVLKHTLLRGGITPFVMELPPYHLPTFRGVILRAWERLRVFLFRAGRVLVPVIVVLTLLNSMGTDWTFGHEDTGDSVLAHIGQEITPAFAPMGIHKGNWPATVGIFSGIFAKEAVVGTLNSLYSQISGATNGEEANFDFWGGIKDAFLSIPANLKELGGSLLDPLGLSSVKEGKKEMAEEEGLNFGTFGSMARLFDGKIGAYAYLLFILLYVPCVVAMSVTYREAGLRWMVFSIFWTIFMAYLASSGFYQLATLGRHPSSSLIWVTIEVLAFSGVVMLMRFIGERQSKASLTAVAAKA